MLMTKIERDGSTAIARQAVATWTFMPIPERPKHVLSLLDNKSVQQLGSVRRTIGGYSRSAIRARTAAFAVCPLRDVAPFPSAPPSSVAEAAVLKLEAKTKL
jgi:hypothetical protein